MTETTTIQRRHLGRVGVLFATFAVAIACLGASAPGASAAPKWSATTYWGPSTFQPGERGGIRLEVGNVGDETAEGWPTVEIDLPAGVEFDANNTSEGFGWSCTASGTPQTITCGNPLAAFFELLWPKPNTYIGFGNPIYLELTVDISPSAPTGVQPLITRLFGAGATQATTLEDQVRVGGPTTAFGIREASFTAEVFDEEGNPYLQAGGHPHEVVSSFFPNLKFNDPPNPSSLPDWTELLEPVENVKDILVEAPAGFAGDPLAVPTCTPAKVSESSCPPEAQIGVAETNNVGLPAFQMFAVYNIVPQRGAPAQFMFDTPAGPALLTPVVQSDGEWSLRVDVRNITEANPLFHAEVALWGVPADSSHDAERCFSPNHIGEICAGRTANGQEPGSDTYFPHASTAPRRALLTNPTECDGQPETSFQHNASWLAPAPFTADGDPDLSDPRWITASYDAPPVTGCEALEFEPSMKARPTTNAADSPTGLDVDLHIPQAPPEIDVIGQAKVCSAGSWSASPSGFAFQWLRDGEPIPGATTDTYATSSADIGTALQCEVRATNAATAPGLATSRPIHVQPASSTLPGFSVPTVSGSVDGSGGTLTCNPGTWAGASFAFQWLKDGAPIAGAEDDELTVGADEAPAAFHCRVAATASAGTVVAYSGAKFTDPAPSPLPPVRTSPPVVYTPAEEWPLASAHLRDVTTTLPEGLVINPSGANGLGACSEDQANLDTRLPDDCPEDAKLGKVTVETPVLGNPLPGAVYVAKPHDNPFDSLLAIYVTIDDPQTGIVGKIAGEVKADPQTGRLTATFQRNPQLPFEDLHLDFFGGAAAALKTPATCGKYTTASQLASYAAPGTLVASSDTWQILKGPNGAPCATSEAELPNSPAFDAGSSSPIAGAHSPFVIELSRADGTQRLRSVTVTPPKGLLATLAGTATCPDAALAAAARKDGREEQSSPSCPAASRVGTVVAAAGAGPAPYHAPGVAYLTGPYKGAPLSLAIVTPAVAGPFDLGTIVVRTAIAIDPRTAQITATSDEIPHILDGIPLNLRSVSVRLDRPQFTLNPTSCDESAVDGQLVSTLGQPVSLSSRFQLGECGRLGFKPKLGMRLVGPSRRGAHPRLRAEVRMPAANANIATASVALPGSVILENAHIRTICTRPQFEADACPKGAVYGKAVAYTPLLDEPLSGPVYLRANGGARDLPDLVAALRGPGHRPIEVELVGYIDSVRGRLRNRFEMVPDAPVSRFVLTMQGKRKGLLVNATNICRGKHRATALFGAHNGKERIVRPLIKAGCGKASRKGRGGR